MAQTETRPAAPAGLESEPDFIELPDAGSPSRPSPRQRSSAARTEDSLRSRLRQRSKKRLPPPIVVADEPPKDLTWDQWIARQLSGDEGAALGMSLILHLMLIALLAVVIIGHVQKGPIFTTVLTEGVDDGFVLGAPLDTELSAAELEGGEQFQLPDLLADESKPITDALFSNSAAGAGDGIGTGDVVAGMQRFVPDNAVTAGSFTAWTTPTFGHPDRGEYYARRFGEPDPEPGDSPRPGQPYYITIQIKIPEGRRRFPIRDLTGVIVGTDGYQQRLPEHTYVLDQDGRATRPRGTSIPVIDGTVQLVVFVPGARELVKDTIEVSSNLLEEEQSLEIVFEPPRTLEPPRN